MIWGMAVPEREIPVFVGDSVTAGLSGDEL